jgi:hypothetical protein
MPKRLYAPDPLAPPEPYSLRWRMGAGVAEMTPLAFDWPPDRPGWFLNWTLGIIGPEGIPQRIEEVRLRPRPAEAVLGMEYVPVVRVKFGRFRFSEETIIQVAAANPGRTLIIGNEPDVEAQDWATPEQYAAAYHAAYSAITTADPTAKIAAASLSQITPLRLRYLDAVWRAYQAQFGEEMPVDLWTMHAFVLREEAGNWGVGVPPGLDPSINSGLLWEVEDHADLANVEQQVRRMRAWMAAHGQTDKPLWVTEYGLLLPAELGFTPEVAADFMRGSFDLFRTLRDEETGYAADDHRLVQRWIWFSTNFPEHPAGNLFDDTGQPTLLMQTMADYLAEHGKDE